MLNNYDVLLVQKKLPKHTTGSKKLKNIVTNDAFRKILFTVLDKDMAQI